MWSEVKKRTLHPTKKIPENAKMWSDMFAFGSVKFNLPKLLNRKKTQKKQCQLMAQHSTFAWPYIREQNETFGFDVCVRAIFPLSIYVGCWRVWHAVMSTYRRRSSSTSNAHGNGNKWFDVSLAAVAVTDAIDTFHYYLSLHASLMDGSYSSELIKRRNAIHAKH